MRQVGTLAEGGVGRRVDVLQAAARLAQAQSSLASQQGQLEQAGSSYRHVIGRAPGALLPPSLWKRSSFPSASSRTSSRRSPRIGAGATRAGF